MTEFIDITSPDTEEVGDALIAILQTHLPAVLTALTLTKATRDTARFGASIDLDAPDADSYYFGDDVLIGGAFPSVLICPTDTLFDVDGKRSTSLDTGNVERNAFTIDIYIIDDQVEKVSRKVVRYARAVANVLRHHADLDIGNPVKASRLGKATYGQGRHPGGMLFRFASVPVVVETMTDSDNFIAVA